MNYALNKNRNIIKLYQGLVQLPIYDFVSSEGNLKIQLCDMITTIKVLCLVVDWYTFKISRDKQSTIS